MILDAAANVLDREGVNDTSLNAIAQEAGVVKSGLYRYFESREEILLELMISDVQVMCAALSEVVTGPMDVDQVSDLISEGFTDRPRLCLLTSRMASTLEHNITGDTIRAVKRRLNACSEEVSQAIRRAIPHWTPEESRRGMRMIFVLVAGLYPMTHPPAHVKSVMNEPEFQDVVPEFVPSVRVAARAMFRGIESMALQRQNGI